MTPEQAYSILTQVCANFRGTLAEHKQIQEALEVLKPKVNTENITSNG